MKRGTAAERQAAVPTTMNSGVSHLTDFFTVLNRALSLRLYFWHVSGQDAVNWDTDIWFFCEDVWRTGLAGFVLAGIIPENLDKWLYEWLNKFDRFQVLRFSDSFRDSLMVFLNILPTEIRLSKCFSCGTFHLGKVIFCSILKSSPLLHYKVYYNIYMFPLYLQSNSTVIMSFI